jgi:hypothetical protein
MLPELGFKEKGLILLLMLQLPGKGCRCGYSGPKARSFPLLPENFGEGTYLMKCPGQRWRLLQEVDQRLKN